MLNTAILIAVVILLHGSLKRLGKLLRVGSLEALIKNQEEELAKTKERLKDANYKGLFTLAWFFVLILLSVTTALSVYILTNILNFV